MSSTHYDVLGVDRHAPPEEIKKAYRALSLKWHPDRNNSPEAQAKFQEINQAHEVLGDDERRKQYDRELDGLPAFGGPEHEMHMNMSDFINVMFGSGMTQGYGPNGPMGGPGIHIFHGFPGGGGSPMDPFFRQFQKPPPIVRALELTLEQAYTGCLVTIAVDRWVLRNDVKVTEQETLHIQVQAGIDHDEMIVLQNAGNTISDDLRGDVKFIVKLAKHATFVREGVDLVVKKTLSLKEALLGFHLEFTHLSGKPINVINRPEQGKHTIVHPGHRRTIAGLGMVRQGVTGNMVIEFSVQFPDSLTAEQMVHIHEAFP